MAPTFKPAQVKQNKNGKPNNRNKPETGRATSTFEQAFRNIDDVLRKEAGCTTELDYTEQTSWLLFLKYLDNLEEERALEAQLAGKQYSFILDEQYRWASWAAPKNKDGKIDYNNAMTGDDLTDFVSQKKSHEMPRTRNATNTKCHEYEMPRRLFRVIVNSWIEFWDRTIRFLTHSGHIACYNFYLTARLTCSRGANRRAEIAACSIAGWSTR